MQEEQSLPPVKIYSSVNCMKNEKTIYMKFYITHQEQLEITESIGDSAVLLYMYYLRMASLPHPVITDETAAKSLGWTPRKVKRYRLLLVKDGWYKESKYTRGNGTKGVEYHIGKDAVSHFNAGL